MSASLLGATEPRENSLAALRVPPHSLEAEQSVLGSLLLDNGAWDRASDVLVEGDFYRHEHRLIFAAIGVLIAATKPADVITVFEHLERAGKAGDAGGMLYLSGLAGSVPSAANVRRYAEIVRERALLRKLIQTADEAAAAAWRAEDFGATVERFASEFAHLASTNTRKAPRSLDQLVVERLDRINERHENGGAGEGWPTKIQSLDRMLNGGLRTGTLVVLAARPSVGKSSFASSLGETLAEQGLPTLMLSQEMPEAEATERVLSRVGGIDYGRLQRGALEDHEWGRLSAAAERAARMPFYIDDQPALTLGDMRAKARSVKGLAVLIVDYLQLCASTRRDGNRNSEIEEISRGLKSMAKAMGIVVIALSQLNREVERRHDKRPTLSDLRDSGAIEQDADVVMFLWPVRELAAEQRRIVGLAIEKNRQGLRGAFGLDFYGAQQRWRESTADIAPGPIVRRNDL